MHSFYSNVGKQGLTFRPEIPILVRHSDGVEVGCEPASNVQYSVHYMFVCARYQTLSRLILRSSEVPVCGTRETRLVRFIRIVSLSKYVLTWCT